MWYFFWLCSSFACSKHTRSCILTTRYPYVFTPNNLSCRSPVLLGSIEVQPAFSCLRPLFFSAFLIVVDFWRPMYSQAFSALWYVQYWFVYKLWPVILSCVGPWSSKVNNNTRDTSPDTVDVVLRQWEIFGRIMRDILIHFTPSRPLEAALHYNISNASHLIIVIIFPTLTHPLLNPSLLRVIISSK